MPPYPIIRKLFSQFGIDVMAAEAVKTMLDRQRATGVRIRRRDAGQGGARTRRRGRAGLDGRDRRSPNWPASASGCRRPRSASASACGAATIMARGTLAQKERWLPRADDDGEDRGVGDHRARLRLGRVRRDEDLRRARRRRLHPQRAEDVHHQRPVRRHHRRLRQARRRRSAATSATARC